jgi:hypothetical protein
VFRRPRSRRRLLLQQKSVVRKSLESVHHVRLWRCHIEAAPQA